MAQETTMEFRHCAILAWAVNDGLAHIVVLVEQADLAMPLEEKQ